MEQLVERVSAALAAEYPGAPNGRVREVPDRRSIRWYTTIGLVDRPLGTRGRTVLYGPRHLLQLVAIKRRQAAGRTLAEIQAELAGASEETLAAVARVPDRLLDTDGPAVPPSPWPRPSFWKAAPAEPDGLVVGVPAGFSADTSSPLASPVIALPAAADTSFPLSDSDASPPATADPSLTVAADTSPPATADHDGPAQRGTVRRELADAIDALVPAGQPVPPLITGVSLGDGVILLLPRHTADLDRDDIVAAARPLLDLLASRGLTDGRNA